MGRHKTFANNGSLTTDDLNQIQVQAAAALETWRPWKVLFAGTAGAPTYGVLNVMGEFGGYDPHTLTGGKYLGGGGRYGFMSWNPNVGQYRKAMLRYHIFIVPNHPNAWPSLTFGIYPLLAITSMTGSSPGASQVSSSPLAGSSVSSGAVNPGTPKRVTSGEFPVPQSGNYVLGFTMDNDLVAGTDRAAIRADIQVRTISR